MAESGCVLGCLKGFKQLKKAGVLPADKDPGNENQQYFPYKYRDIATKQSIHESTANNRRHTKKYQNPQFSTHIHLHVPPSRFLAHIQSCLSVVYHLELVLNISNNAKLSKGIFSWFPLKSALKSTSKYPLNAA
jgi:hypothetical protein